MTRRELLCGAAGIVSAAILPAMAEQKIQKPPPLAADLVKDFVGAAHGDLEKTKKLLAETPGLLNATWDWGGGDFESAIGGAGHMGRRDIALFLIEKGARSDIFVGAMLGELEFVKACLSKHPNLLTSGGPHGIPLVRHAEAGGKDAEDVLKYLKSLG